MTLPFDEIGGQFKVHASVSPSFRDTMSSQGTMDFIHRNLASVSYIFYSFLMLVLECKKWKS
jgi:hypothetical protein